MGLIYSVSFFFMVGTTKHFLMWSLDLSQLVISQTCIKSLFFSYLVQALKDEERHQKEAERLLTLDERKRPYNSLRGDNKEVTEEQLEAYRMKRRDQDDPMKNFLDPVD